MGKMTALVCGRALAEWLNRKLDKPNVDAATLSN
jgi:hypothetical protein